MDTTTHRVYVRHVVAAGFCLVPGARDWFTSHGISWRDFIKEGVEISVVEATNDSLGLRVAQIARKEHENGR